MSSVPHSKLLGALVVVIGAGAYAYLVALPRYSLPDDLQHPARQEQLDSISGEWQVSLRLSRRIKPAQGVDWPIGGELALAPSPTRDSAGVEVPCRGCLRGNFRLDAAIGPYSWPRGAITDSTLIGVLDADGRLFLRLGGCCEVGELELVGLWAKDKIKGNWEQTLMAAEVPRGLFALQRSVVYGGSGGAP